MRVGADGVCFANTHAASCPPLQTPALTREDLHNGSDRCQASQGPAGLNNFWETVCQDLLQTKTFPRPPNHQTFLPFVILNTTMLLNHRDFNPENQKAKWNERVEMYLKNELGLRSSTHLPSQDVIFCANIKDISATFKVEPGFMFGRCLANTSPFSPLFQCPCLSLHLVNQTQLCILPATQIPSHTKELESQGHTGYLWCDY